MNCQTLLTITNKKAMIDGGTQIIQSKFVSHNDIVKVKEQLDILSSNGDTVYEFDDKKASQVFTKDGNFNTDYVLTLASKDSKKIVKELLRLHDPLDLNGNRLSFHLVKSYNCYFDVEDIMNLGNPTGKENNESTLSHLLVSRMLIRPTVDELILMGNPKDTRGNTLAHAMMSVYEDCFDFDDIVRLGNPVNDGMESLAHCCIYRAKRPPFSLQEIYQLNNCADDNGNTLAHWMRHFNNVDFTEAEIYYLGNPKNRWGEDLVYYRPSNPLKLVKLADEIRFRDL